MNIERIVCHNGDIVCIELKFVQVTLISLVIIDFCDCCFVVLVVIPPCVIGVVDVVVVMYD